MYDEHNTSAYLRQQLDSLGIPYQYALDLSLWLVTNTLAAEQIDTSARIFCIPVLRDRTRKKMCLTCSVCAHEHCTLLACGRHLRLAAVKP